MKNRNDKALPMLIFSMVIYGSIGIFRKYIPLASAPLACFRGFCGAAFLFAVSKLQKRKASGIPAGKTLALLIISGAVMGANWIFLFEAFNYTSVSTATLCYYMEPTIVMLLSPLLFKEKLGLKKVICIIVSFAGMVLVSGVADNGLPAASELKGVILGLAAAVLYSIVVILNKKLPGLDPYQKTIIQLLSAGVAMLPYVFLTKQTQVSGISSKAVVMLLIVGFVHTGVAYGLYFGSIDALKAQTVAVCSYLDPVTALILSAVILHEKMTAFGIIGAVLIIGAALASELNPEPGPAEAGA